MKVQWMWGKRIEIWRDFISNNGKIASCGIALPLRTTRKDGERGGESDLHQRTSKGASVRRKGTKLK